MGEKLPFYGYYWSYFQDTLPIPAGENEFKTDCPKGHDSATKSFCFNAMSGVFMCHGCGWAGNAQAFAKVTGHKLPKELRQSKPKEKSKPKAEPKHEPEPMDEGYVFKHQHALTPDRMLFLKEKRGLSEEVIKRRQLGYCERTGRYTVPIRNEDGGLINFRKYRPYPESGDAKMISSKDRGQVALYPLDTLDREGVIYICEGELDVLALESRGHLAITNTNGAGKWKSGLWRDLFFGREIVLVGDNDEPGRKHNEKIAWDLQGKAKSIAIADFSEMKPSEDITNWLVDYGRRVDEIPLTIWKSGEAISIGEVKARFRELLQIKDDTVIDVVAGAFVSNRLESDPVWLFVVGAPSSTKTEIVNTLQDIEESYFLSSLTEHTLFSGRNKQGKNLSLLLQPEFKDRLRIMVMKDFGSILSMRPETQSNIMATLREVYDGSYARGYGESVETGKFKTVVRWSGKIGLIAATTNTIDSSQALRSQLGERFLSYRIVSDDRKMIGRKAMALAGKEGGHRLELRKTMHQFLSQFEDCRMLPLEKGVEDRLIALADFCSVCRTGVLRSAYGSRDVEVDPDPEGPARLIKQLYALASGIGIVNRRAEIDGEIFETVAKIALDCIPGQRRRVLRYLWEQKEINAEWVKTKDVSRAIRKPTKTVLVLLDDLWQIGMIEKETAFTGGDGEGGSYEWELSKLAVDLTKESGCPP